MSRSARAGRARRRIAIVWVALVLPGCGTPPADAGPSADATSSLDAPLPVDGLRVVSLVPAASAMAVALGAADAVVGRTLDDATPRVGHAATVGRVLAPDLETVVALRPDVVLAWAGADLEPLRRSVAPAGARVLPVVLDRLDDVSEAWSTVGEAVGRPDAAARLRRVMEDALADVAASVPPGPPPSVLWIVGAEPAVAVGPGTFLDDLLSLVGARNVLADGATPWPRPGFEALAALDPDLVLWGAPAPPPQARHPWSTLPAVADGRLHRIDPDRFHEPGPDLPEVARILARIVHAGRRPAPPSGTDS